MGFENIYLTKRSRKDGGYDGQFFFGPLYIQTSLPASQKKRTTIKKTPRFLLVISVKPSNFLTEN
jgi:hypothetical protein